MNTSTLYAAAPCTITTVSGRRIDLNDPDPQSVSIADIAHHLAGVPRYGGALADKRGDPLLYMVAQHSVLVAAAALEDPRSARRPMAVALKALLHDAPEYLAGDATSPLKMAMRWKCSARHGYEDPLSDYDCVENDLAAAIAARFCRDSDSEIAAIVKTADVRLYTRESEVLRGWNRERFADHGGTSAMFDDRWTGHIKVWKPKDAKRIFAACLAVARWDSPNVGRALTTAVNHAAPMALRMHELDRMSHIAHGYRIALGGVE